MNNSASILLRYSLAAIFLWFGWQQLSDPGAWVIYLPAWTGYLPIPPDMLIKLNGWLEIIGALFIIIGVYTQAVAWLLGLHLLAIAWSVGGITGVRDAGLALATIALALSRPDQWTLDRRGGK